MKHFSKAQILKHIAVYFLLFLAGELLNALFWDLVFSVVELPVRALYSILRMAFCLPVTYLLFRFYTTKVLHLKMQDFDITFAIQKWGILSAVLLPALVVSVYLLVGNTTVNTFSFAEILLIAAASLLMALKSGILEEMLFRGFIMKLLEIGWNRTAAILFPSVLFALLHIPSMNTFNITSLLLLTVSGTLVGIMFSLAAYKGNSISNSALLHAVWNFVVISDILHITTAQEAYGAPLIAVTIPSEHILLTGGGFGVEASIVAIIGYFAVCCSLYFVKTTKSSVSE